MRVNVVTLSDREVTKERRVGAGLVIAAGNVYFRLASARFRMFASLTKWVLHEQRMFRLLHQREVRRDGRAIVMPRLHGRDLSSILGEPDVTMHDRALGLCGRMVGSLHDRGISHGDLNTGNLIVDDTTARVIDFDAAHDERDPIAVRAADDVLGFVLDLSRFAGGEDDFRRRVALFGEAYGRRSVVVRELRLLAGVHGFLGSSLLRARAHGASRTVVARRVALAASLLDRSDGS
ncbi:hypothetical protein BH09MYX1_BH09MYX1_08040 [soil metagenome]